MKKEKFKEEFRIEEKDIYELESLLNIPIRDKIKKNTDRNYKEFRIDVNIKTIFLILIFIPIVIYLIHYLFF